jgi:5-methylthioribose kinase
MQCTVLIVGKTDVKKRCITLGGTLDREETLSEYKALTPETLAQRLSGLNAIVEKIGSDFKSWDVEEVGDGNLNLVFIVKGTEGTVIVKQALPYVRLVGDSWPLPLKRAFFEYHAMTRQAAHDPGRVPQILYFDETQALIIMEFLSPHIILRHQMMAGKKVDDLGSVIGIFCARTAFKSSDLSMVTKQKKADLALFSDNVELCDITENLVFTDPYFDAEMNQHNSPRLDKYVSELRSDQSLKVEAQHMKRAFSAKGECLCHGDLHAGSIMVTPSEAKVIDPEFAFYGPFGFDIGMLIGNYLMAYHSMSSHIKDPNKCAEYQAWILDVIRDTWSSFCEEFSKLWHSERNGILYPSSLYEDQGHDAASAMALEQLLDEIFADLLGFAGIEMHRRILGLAHVAELDSIEDLDDRARHETKALALGRRLVLNRNSVQDIAQVIALAAKYENGELA